MLVCSTKPEPAIDPAIRPHVVAGMARRGLRAAERSRLEVAVYRKTQRLHWSSEGDEDT